ncbi:hypothetical protein KY343_01075 [Candidatus Woesearchaeota archaeon]|nr:hypothetical protein [Candidatus Woesearchaeota archaeon]
MEFGKENCYAAIMYGVYELVMPITLNAANRLIKSQGNEKALEKVRLDKTFVGLSEIIEMLEVEKASPKYVEMLGSFLNEKQQPVIGEEIKVYRNITPYDNGR